MTKLMEIELVMTYIDTDIRHDETNGNADDNSTNETNDDGIL